MIVITLNRRNKVVISKGSTTIAEVMLSESSQQNSARIAIKCDDNIDVNRQTIVPVEGNHNVIS